MLISIKANCIDSTAPAEQVFAMEVEKLRQEKFFPKEQLTLEPYERDHAVSSTHNTLIHLGQLHNTNFMTDGLCRLQAEGVRGLSYWWSLGGRALFLVNFMIQGVLLVGLLFPFRFGNGE